jgi:GTP pyrophosphokinase
MTKPKKIEFPELLEVVKTYNTNEEELEIIKQAYEYAKQVHAGEKLLTGDDYITHPLRVAYILTDIKADYATISAALLHDTYKTTKDIEEQIGTKFSSEITNLVKGICKINQISFDATGSDDKIKQQRKILVGLSEDVRVIIIKLANRLDNMRTLWVVDEESQKEKATETQEILVPIANRLGMSKIKGELEDLCLRYLKPDAYFSIVELLNQSKQERDEAVKDMMNHVSSLLTEANIKHELKGRSKSIYGIYKKMQKGKKFNDIYDILALRVYVETVEECYHVLGIIHSKYTPVPKRFKDYIAMPKTNMYQSLHTTVFGEKGSLYEVQIRTYEMDEIAERGIASHWAYKENNANNVGTLMKNTMEQKLQFFRSLIELQKEETTDEEFVNSVKEDIFKENVYVFTPSGDVIELPVGSTPIDFAYKVHTKIGDKMVGAIVNNNIVPLDYKLQDNDIVKINTSNNSAGPSYEWINIAYTNQAKSKIKAFHNRVEKEDYLKRGEEILKDELRRKKISINDFLKDENLEEVFKFFKVSTIDELYINIGSNKITPGSILNFYLSENTSKEEIILKKTQNATVVAPSVKNDIIVEGIDEIKVNVASCCKPIPGDNILGYITKGDGITVHRSICPNVKDLEERIISVRWNSEIEKKYPCNLLIRTLKNDTILLSILSKTSNNNITMQSVSTIQQLDSTLYDMILAMPNVETLNKFEQDVKSIPDVLEVTRGIK